MTEAPPGIFPSTAYTELAIGHQRVPVNVSLNQSSSGPFVTSGAYSSSVNTKSLTRQRTNVKPELRSVAVVSQPTTSLQLYVVHELVRVAARHEV